MAKKLLDSSENDPNLNQEIINTYDLLTELESNAKNVKQSKDSFIKCATDFLEYSIMLAQVHHSETAKNQKAKGLIDLVQQRLKTQTSLPLYEPTENSCRSISSLRLGLDAIYASTIQEGTPKDEESHREL